MPANIIAKSLSACPRCGSSGIYGDSVDIEFGNAFQECSCEECGLSWVDRYEYAESVELRDRDGSAIEDPSGFQNIR